MAFHHLDQRRLARAVRAEQAEQFAGGDPQIDAADGFQLPIDLVDVTHLDSSHLAPPFPQAQALIDHEVRLLGRARAGKCPSSCLGYDRCHE